MKDIEMLLRKQARIPDAVARAKLAEHGLAGAASSEGLLDVAYAKIDSPVGRLILARTRKGLARLAYGDEERVTAELAATISPRVLEAPSALDTERRQLDEYFEGRRREFDLDLDLSLVRSPFQRRVLKSLQRIGFGEVATYGELATRSGTPNAYRAAGTACGRNPLAIVIPCHRVLKSGGKVGNYGGGTPAKEYLLRLEGAIPPAP